MGTERGNPGASPREGSRRSVGRRPRHVAPRWWPPLLAGGLLVTAGCYAYTAVDVDTVPVGETVRARISSEGLSELPAFPGGQPEILEGELLENGREGVLLFVPSMTRQVGFRFETMNQRLLIAREDVLAVEQRQLDKSRTVGLLGVVGVATTVTLVQLLGGTSGSSTGPGGPEGPAARVIFPVGWVPIP